MTSLASPFPDVQSDDRGRFPVRLALTLGLAAFADFLFWSERIGISFVFFAAAPFAGTWLGNLAGFELRRAIRAVATLLAGLVPAAEEFNALSFFLAIAALVLSVAVLTNPDFSRLTDGLRVFRDLLLVGPFRLTGDLVRLFSMNDLTSGFAKWCVPVAFGLLFLLLFASANPLIEKWIKALNPANSASSFNLARMLFWAFVLSMVWPFVHVRWRRRTEGAAASVEAVTDHAEPRGNMPDLFGKEAILRSLILFNLLFAIQTGLDLVYLWGNAALPADVTYAGYAHRGAYPLIATALLAAGFVLAAMRPGRTAEKSRVIRPLVYLWVAQNVMMVASSILRLQLYVETYLLTRLRIAAFVWMLLVAAGLVLIVARIILKQSNGWLIRMNLISLAATLYACALVNFPAIYELGPQALPALDRALLLPGISVSACGRNRLRASQAADMASWRSWGFRSWRLQRWLDRQPDQPSTRG